MFVETCKYVPGPEFEIECVYEMLKGLFSGPRGTLRHVSGVLLNRLFGKRHLNSAQRGSTFYEQVGDF
jgi:hypothetical protein